MLENVPLGFLLAMSARNQGTSIASQYRMHLSRSRNGISPTAVEHEINPEPCSAHKRASGTCPMALLSAPSRETKTFDGTHVRHNDGKFPRCVAAFALTLTHPSLTKFHVQDEYWDYICSKVGRRIGAHPMH